MYVIVIYTDREFKEFVYRIKPLEFKILERERERDGQNGIER